MVSNSDNRSSAHDWLDELNRTVQEDTNYLQRLYQTGSLETVFEASYIGGPLDGLRIHTTSRAEVIAYPKVEFGKDQQGCPLPRLAADAYLRKTVSIHGRMVVFYIHEDIMAGRDPDEAAMEEITLRVERGSY